MPKSLLVLFVALTALVVGGLVVTSHAQAGAGGAGMGGAAGGEPPVVRVVDPNVPMTLPGGHKKTDQMRGFSMRLERPPESIDSYLKAIDDLADMGCTWVNLIVAGRQQDVHSEAVAWDFNVTPSEDEVLQIMKRAKDRGMGVMLMPVVLLRQSGSKDWRGIIDPQDASGKENWDNWFMSYNDFICKMATMAQEGDVDIFCVGSELLSTEDKTERWKSVISNIKKCYKGKLTYSSNWDHYESVTFWDQLDYVGMNNYYELSDKPDASVAELDKAWDGIRDKILKFTATQKKPFFFTEVGWHNLACTLSQPWNYVAEGPIDHGPQTHAFESFVESWHTVPKSQFMGAFIYEWCPLGHVTDHGTYSLQDTPALKVVQGWFAEP